jgi:hypothetical protein
LYSVGRNAPSVLVAEHAPARSNSDGPLEQRTCFRRSVAEARISLHWWPLLDFDADARDRIGIDDGVDFLALFDHHEVQVHRRERISGDIDHSRPRAIRVDLVGPTAAVPRGGAQPFWSEARDNDVVHLYWRDPSRGPTRRFGL